jgi:Reverse transcriptase (RNA-dependent DNA polymerase)/Endonuclease-reverse transcriptase
MVNIQGFHLDVARLLIRSAKPDVLVLTETHITEDWEDQEIDIKGYNKLNVVSSSRHTGGILVFLVDNIKYSNVRIDVRERAIWSISLNIRDDESRIRYNLFAMYRSPNSSSKCFLKFLNEWSENIMNGCEGLIVCGDFNLNWANEDHYVKKLKKWVNDNGMKQVVNDWTRVTNVSSTIIDLVITNMYDEIECKTEDMIVSDHLAINIMFRGNNKRKKGSMTTFLKRINYERLKEVMEEMNESNESFYDLDDTVKNLYNVIGYGIEIATEIKKINHVHTLKPWFGDSMELKDALKIRNECYKKVALLRHNNEQTDQAWNEYKSARNRAVSILRKVKKEWYEERVDRMKKNPFKMWQVLKELISSKSNKCKVWTEILFDDKLCKDMNMMPETWNKYVNDTLNLIVDSVAAVDDTCEREIIINDMSGTEGFSEFKEIDLDLLVAELNGIKSAVSSDGVDQRVITSIWKWLAHRLLDIINRSLKEGVVPAMWKVSKIIPVPKIPNTCKAEEIRPINLLPVMEKILEGVVLAQVKKYIDVNNILVDCQSGFRQRHSTETAIQLVVSDWLDAVDDRRVVGAVFLDLKRAFETIDRKRLLLKLEQMGFGGTVLKWFESYLNDRYQYAEMNGISSDRVKVEWGVPQGSRVGPLLFILYINDMVHVIRKCKIHLFADDALMYISDKCPDNICKWLNEDLKNVSDWLNSNKLKLNIKKTKVMWINERSNRVNEIRMNGEVLEVVKNIKYLGVMIDDRMKFDLHADYIIKKMARKIGVLNRLRSTLSTKAKTLVYSAIISPHVTYCSTFWVCLVRPN